jgi:hypothetical protein
VGVSDVPREISSRDVNEDDTADAILPRALRLSTASRSTSSGVGYAGALAPRSSPVGSVTVSSKGACPPSWSILRTSWSAMEGRWRSTHVGRHARACSHVGA